MALHPAIRRQQRFELAAPHPGHLGSTKVVLRDLSPIGAGIRHWQQFPDRRGELRFEWDGQPLNVACSVIHSRLERWMHHGVSLTLYRSGLRFLLPVTPVAEELKRILAARLEGVLAAQVSNAYAVSIDEAKERLAMEPEGEIAVNLNDLFADSSPERGYITCVYRNGVWSESCVATPTQPEEGFTITAAEGADAIALLRKTYEAGDREQRRMIQTFANLTVTDPSDVPPQRFKLFGKTW
ncbi:MAG TPA: PilZ domain-containing protein [Thermoanaerobaculia bacterium]